MQDILVRFVSLLHSLPNEINAAITLSVCVIFILAMLRYFGAAGLLVYSALATIVANIQVLKTVQYSLSNEPVALGTVIFSTVFLVGDILTQHFGKKVAIQSVYLSFLAQVFVTLTMLLTIGAKIEAESVIQSSLETLFLPSMGILAASLIAFFLSQRLEITAFAYLQRYQSISLGMRTGVSGTFAALLDNIIFSTLAWVIFAQNPVDLHTLVFTYILGTYVTRAIISLLTIPVMYMTCTNLCKPRTWMHD